MYMDGQELLRDKSCDHWLPSCQVVVDTRASGVSKAVAELCRILVTKHV